MNFIFETCIVTVVENIQYLEDNPISAFFWNISCNNYLQI